MAGYVLRIISFIIITINFVMADPFKPLDTDFLDTKTPKKKSEKDPLKNGKKYYKSRQFNQNYFLELNEDSNIIIDEINGPSWYKNQKVNLHDINKENR